MALKTEERTLTLLNQKVELCMTAEYSTVILPTHETNQSNH
jgi:hypothetical protein